MLNANTEPPSLDKPNVAPESDFVAENPAQMPREPLRELLLYDGVQALVGWNQVHAWPDGKAACADLDLLDIVYTAPASQVKAEIPLHLDEPPSRLRQEICRDFVIEKTFEIVHLFHLCALLFGMFTFCGNC
jgi:hypothetical protein